MLRELFTKRMAEYHDFLLETARKVKKNEEESGAERDAAIDKVLSQCLREGRRIIASVRSDLQLVLAHHIDEEVTAEDIEAIIDMDIIRNDPTQAPELEKWLISKEPDQYIFWLLNECTWPNETIVSELREIFNAQMKNRKPESPEEDGSLPNTPILEALDRHLDEQQREEHRNRFFDSCMRMSQKDSQGTSGGERTVPYREHIAAFMERAGGREEWMKEMRSIHEKN